MLEPDQWDSVLSRARGTIYRNTERISSNARFAANTSAFGDPHQLPKTELTPPSALVKLTTPIGSPFFHRGARHEKSPSRLC